MSRNTPNSRRSPKSAVLTLAILVLPALPAGPGYTGEYTAGDLAIEDPTSRATPPGVSVGVGYMKITNHGTESDRLVGASTPAARQVQLHRTVEKDAMMRMIEQDDGIEVPGGAPVELAPGGYHMMLMGLDKPLKEGEMVPMTLRFERAGKVEVELRVMPLGSD
jgi:hypothetical protein